MLHLMTSRCLQCKWYGHGLRTGTKTDETRKMIQRKPRGSDSTRKSSLLHCLLRLISERTLCAQSSLKVFGPLQDQTQSSLLIYLFDLPLSAACVSHVAAQGWDDDPTLPAAQVLSGPLPISVYTWYVQNKKGLFQQLGTKGRKWEWSSPFALRQRDNMGMAALPHHTFLLVASSCLGHSPVDVACKGCALTKEVRLSVASWVLRS